MIFLLARKGASLEELERARDKLRGMLLDGPGMKAPINAHKRGIKSRFLKGIGGRDNTGRLNRVANAAEQRPVIRLANRRKAEMQAIYRLISVRRAILRRVRIENAEVAEDVLAKVITIKRQWRGERSISLHLYMDAANAMKRVVDRPWRLMFTRCLEDLRTAYRHHGKPEGMRAIKQIIVCLELLPLYDECADLDKRLSQNRERRVRGDRAKARKRAEFDGIASAMDAIARSLPVNVRGSRVIAQNDGDGILRAPVTPKVCRRLSAARAAISRGEYEEATKQSRRALAAFGG